MHLNRSIGKLNSSAENIFYFGKKRFLFAVRGENGYFLPWLIISLWLPTKLRHRKNQILDFSTRGFAALEPFLAKKQFTGEVSQKINLNFISTTFQAPPSDALEFQSCPWVTWKTAKCNTTKIIIKFSPVLSNRTLHKVLPPLIPFIYAASRRPTTILATCLILFYAERKLLNYNYFLKKSSTVLLLSLFRSSCSFVFKIFLVIRLFFFYYLLYSFYCWLF